MERNMRMILKAGTVVLGVLFVSLVIFPDKEGSSLKLIAVVALLEQLLLSFPVIVYVTMVVGFATTLSPVFLFSDAKGAQV